MKVKKLSESNVPFIESIHSFSLPPHLSSGGSSPQAAENKDEFKNNSSIPFPSNTLLLYPVTAAVIPRFCSLIFLLCNLSLEFKKYKDLHITQIKGV